MMAKFIRVTNIAQGIDTDTILNAMISDISLLDLISFLQEHRSQTGRIEFMYVPKKLSS